jgi:hypothetical protein
MDEDFKEKLKTVNFGKPGVKGKPRVTTVPHEQDGKPAGQFTEHPDGRIDCGVFPRTGHSFGKVNRPGGHDG